VTTPSSGSTALPFDNTIPQNTEGSQFHSKAITPVSAANLLDVDFLGSGTHSSSTALSVALFQDAIANAIAANVVGAASAAVINVPLPLKHRMLAGTNAQTTFKIRCGGHAGATFYYLQGTSGGYYGGVQVGRLALTEYMT